MLKDVYESLGLIIGFTIGTTVCQSFLGDKVTEYMLLLILLGMLLFNADKISAKLKQFKGV